MTYQQFVEAVCSQINSISNGPIYAEVHTSTKNNSVEHIGLTIHEAEINISPTLYLEEFYTHFLEGCPLLDIVYQILEVYEEIRFEHSWTIDGLLSYDSISDRIAFKLIHLQQNLPLLQNVPFVRYQDLVIVFFVLIDIDPCGPGTILITNEMKNFWKISTDDLYKAALCNTPTLFPSDFRPMCAVVNELLRVPCTGEDYNDNHMYVLTNSVKHLGASVILYPNLLETISVQLKEDFYLIPSSIHEFIILPCSHSPSARELNEMVQEINETEVPADEFLSDHVYLFSHDCQKLFIAP